MALTYKEELLVILMEELAELQVEASKLIRFGGETSAPFIKEAGDVYTMLKLCSENDMFLWERLEERRIEKIERLKEFSRLYDER